MQQIRLTVNEHYGDEVIQLPLPERWNVHRVEMACKDAPQLNDDEIRAAIDDTVGASTIEEQAKGKKGKIVVTCDDLSRPTPAGRVFPFIVEQLHNAGISDSQIFILGSFGCHNAMNLDAFARKLGDSVVAKYDCVNHNPFHNLMNLGRTSRGTPVYVNQEFASADLRICISGVKKHIWAGAGGGGKAVLPGVSSIDTILYNHSIIEGARPLNRRIWWIKDNPERQDMQETARMADLNVSVNCVYNHRRELIDLAAGHVDDAWNKAVKSCYKESLREGGTAVAVHRFTAGKALLHYRAEHMGAPWQRICGYPSKRWPVKQAGRIIVYTDRLSKRQMLAYDDRIEWLTDWDEVLKRLKETHGEEASVAVYPCGKIQFDAGKYPLDI
jgi:nickel-dependent lactate racemase